MRIVKKVENKKYSDIYCEKCLISLEKNHEVFVSGSWSVYGYIYFCSEKCYLSVGYKLG